MTYNGLTRERVESMPNGPMPYIISMVGALMSSMTGGAYHFTSAGMPIFKAPSGLGTAIFMG